MTKIGILGFGEAGSAFAPELARGGSAVYAYDRRWEGDRADLERCRAGFPDIVFCGLPELLEQATIVLSAVTTDAALDAANASLPGLGPGKLFCDLNSTAPSVKQRLARAIAPGGAAFVEGAVLGAIGVGGAKTEILLGGERAAELSAILNGLGLNTRAYSREIGKASAFKMLRSVFSKGLEALLVEFLLAGRKAGLEDDLWREITALMAGDRFEAVARNWICSHASAHRRRYHEMRQVNEVLAELDVDAIMSRAAEDFFERSTRVGLADGFADRPADIRQVVDVLSKRLKGEIAE